MAGVEHIVIYISSLHLLYLALSEYQCYCFNIAAFFTKCYIVRRISY